VLLYGWRLGQVALRDWDEGYYALVARKMVVSGDWLHPILHGQPFDKPPLGEWLMASSYQQWGYSEWSTRWPLAFLSAMAIPLLYGVARHLFASQHPALLSALVYLTLLPVVRHGRLAMLDGLTVSLFLAFLAVGFKAQRQPLVGILSGPLLGLMILARGEMALVLAGVAIAIHFATPSPLPRPLSHHRLRLFYSTLGTIIGLTPVGLWYAAQTHQYGTTFWSHTLLGPLWQRIWQPYHDHAGPPWFYLLEIAKYSWPWLIFVPVGLITLKQKPWQKSWQKPWAKACLIGIGGFGGLISLMTTKLPWYSMPIYPFLAMMIGAGLNHMHIASNGCIRLYRIYSYAFMLLAIAGITGCVYLALEEPTALPIGLILVSTFALTALDLHQRHARFIVTLLMGSYASLFLLVGSPLWLWELQEAFPVKPVAALLQQHTPPDSIIATTFAYSRPSLDFYSQRRVIPHAIAELSSAPSDYWLIDPTTATELTSSWQILGKTEDFILAKKSRTQRMRLRANNTFT
jgi:4-amino-4-deoxy-L-arabinose transferase-like glycosyltransferase